MKFSSSNDLGILCPICILLLPNRSFSKCLRSISLVIKNDYQYLRGEISHAFTSFSLPLSSTPPLPRASEILTFSYCFHSTSCV